MNPTCRVETLKVTFFFEKFFKKWRAPVHFRQNFRCDPPGSRSGYSLGFVVQVINASICMLFLKNYIKVMINRFFMVFSISGTLYFGSKTSNQRWNSPRRWAIKECENTCRSLTMTATRQLWNAPYQSHHCLSSFPLRPTFQILSLPLSAEIPVSVECRFPLREIRVLCAAEGCRWGSNYYYYI